MSPHIYGHLSDQLAFWVNRTIEQKTMTYIKLLQRSAVVAFSPDASLLATGTVAGAVDMDFSSVSTLEVRFFLVFPTSTRSC